MSYRFCPLMVLGTLCCVIRALMVSEVCWSSRRYTGKPSLPNPAFSWLEGSSDRYCTWNLRCACLNQLGSKLLNLSSSCERNASRSLLHCFSLPVGSIRIIRTKSGSLCPGGVPNGSSTLTYIVFPYASQIARI